MTSRPDPSQHTFQVVPYYPGDKRPSLLPSKYRLDQAVNRTNELGQVVDQLRLLASARPMVIRVDKAKVDAGEWAPPQLSWQHDATDSELQQRARLLTGEVLYHLRTSLEYLAYHLVWLDRGHPYERSQFPIVADASRWPVARKSIPGLTAAHLERFKALQPFRGTDWTRDLQLLSNIDKHRSALILRIGPESVMSLNPTVVEPDPIDPELYVVRTTDSQAILATDDDRDIMQVLLSLIGHVATLLNWFSPDFGEPADINMKVGS